MTSSSCESRRAGARSAALALLLVSSLLASCKKEAPKPAPPPPKEIDVVVLAPADVRQTGEYLGALLSRGSVTVLPQVNGYIRSVLVKPGQKVTAGTPLIEVDAREESAALLASQAQQASAQANLNLARQVRERTEALYKEGLATAEELDQRRASTEAASAAAAAAAAAVTQRRVAVGYHSVRAAATGVVGDVLVRVGDFVNASTRVTTISQAGALEVSVAVPASRARNVILGTPVEILREDGTVMVPTVVFFVSPDADPATQLVEIKASVPATEGLRSAERVRTRVVFATSSELQVPARAVLRQSGQAFVYVVVEKDGKTIVERRPVELGDLGEEAFVLEKGLVAGERIAVSAIQQLRDGAPVKPKAATAATPAAAPATSTPTPATPTATPATPTATPATPAPATPAAAAAPAAAGSSAAAGR